MNASHEIRTLEEFRGVTGQPVGVIVVTDTTWESKAHRTDCPYVTESNFTTRVVEGRNRNGRYYYFFRYDDAASRPEHVNAGCAHVPLLDRRMSKKPLAAGGRFAAAATLRE